MFGSAFEVVLATGPRENMREPWNTGGSENGGTVEWQVTQVYPAHDTYGTRLENQYGVKVVGEPVAGRIRSQHARERKRIRRA